MPNTPLILGANAFEATVLNPSFAVANLSADDVAGHEAFHVADNLRDMTSWTTGGTNVQRSLYADSLVVNGIQANTVILDRRHNLKGAVVVIGAYTDSTLVTSTATVTCAIPANVGGLPTDANGCLASDGSWWKTFATMTGRVVALTIPALGVGIAPLVTGLYMGLNYRFPEPVNAPFADDFDTDVQVQVNKLSRGGLRAMMRRLNFRKFVMNIDLESTEYAPFDVQVRPLLRYGQPWWICFDDSDATHAGMIAPFQASGNVRYRPNANPVHREIRSMELEEVLPQLWT